MLVIGQITQEQIYGVSRMYLFWNDWNISCLGNYPNTISM